MVPARLLDLTRLVSRLGRGPMTGIDRVEYAYLTHLLQAPQPLWGLVRSAAGWLLLDQPGCARFAQMIGHAAALPPADLMSRLLHRKDPLRAQAETAVRRLAIARAARPGLARLLRRLPAGTSYLNVGHANLTNRGLATLARAGLSVSVLIHDTIPLDHPEFARAGTVEPFRARLAAVASHATRVIHLTDAARRLTETQLARLGRVPPGLVAPIGIDLPKPDPSALPPGLDLSTPYFVTLGTIEPRKNHAFLLDVWTKLPPPAPRLYIVGSRGWADASLLARLDGLPPNGPIRELKGLSDGAVAALLAQACALLAPSLAEGFGLPPVEAASLGTPVIATDLAVTRELLGNKAVYLPASDLYPWVQAVVSQADRQTVTGTQTPWTAPHWGDHFKTVLNLA